MSSATKVLLLLLLPILEIFSTISSLLSSSWCHMAMIIWWKSLLNAVIISFWHLHIRLDKTVIFTCKIVAQCHKHVFVFLDCTCQFFKTGFTYTHPLSTHTAIGWIPNLAHFSSQILVPNSNTSLFTLTSKNIIFFVIFVK